MRTGPTSAASGPDWLTVNRADWDDRSEVHYDPDDRAVGFVEDLPTTYTDGRELRHTVGVQWQHPLGEVLTAIARAGPRLESLHEHDFTVFQQIPALRPSEDPADGAGVYRFPQGSPRPPLSYSLLAAVPNR